MLDRPNSEPLRAAAAKAHDLASKAQTKFAKNEKAGLESSKRAVELDPGNWKYWLRLGERYRGVGLELKERGGWGPRAAKLKSAIDAFDRALKLVPELEPGAASEIYFHRGQAKHELNRYEKALEDYDACLDIAPNNQNCKAARARCLEDLKNP